MLSCGVKGATPLHYAAAALDSELAALLLAHGARSHGRRVIQTPLSIFVWESTNEIH
jgi:hypothetical protein